MNEFIPFPIHYAELQAVYAQTVVKGHRSICISSAESGEGSSTLAYALAQRAAAAGRNTLLVDFNLYRPILNDLTNTPRQAWSPEDDTGDKAIVRFPEQSFAILPAPIGASAAAPFREHHVLEERLKLWLEEFDVIVADTSPLNNVNARNIPAELVCSSCDATILVVLSGRTAETNIRRAVERLRDAQANLIGTVLNDRYNPHLAEEMIRETRRLDKWVPGIMEKIRRKIRNSPLFMAKI